jgi:hypothetical protein
MKLEEYDHLPDGMTAAEVAELIDIFLGAQSADSRRERFMKLETICDKQWHTYELPGQEVQEKIQRWIEVNWEDSIEYFELAMGLCYCFALSKRLFEEALKDYAGEQRWEYVQMLENSNAETLDPYWSLRSMKG